MARTAPDPKLIKAIEDCLRKPIFFRDIIEATNNCPYRNVLQAWGDVRTRLNLKRDEHGRYWRADI